jgi:ankyrin repeat protein
LEIAFILIKGLADWKKQSQTIEFLVKDALANINATGMDGLAAVHIAAVNNHITALKVLEKLGYRW